MCPRGGRLGWGCSEHPSSTFPSFFCVSAELKASAVGAARIRGPCIRSRDAQPPICADPAASAAPQCKGWEGLGVLGGQDVGCAQPAKLTEQAASPDLGLARSRGHLVARIRLPGARWGVFGITAPEFSLPSAEELLSSWPKLTRGAQWGLRAQAALGVLGGDVGPPRLGTPTLRGCLGHGQKRHLVGSASLCLEIDIHGNLDHSLDQGHPPAPTELPGTVSGHFLQDRAVTALNNPELS